MNMTSYRVNGGSDRVDLRRDLGVFAGEARIRPEAEDSDGTQHRHVDDVREGLETNCAEHASRQVQHNDDDD